MLRIVPLYASVLALMFVGLSIRVIGARRAEKVVLGVGQSLALERRVRAHANFAEYAPFALLLLSMAELRGARPFTLHALGLVLIAGRAAHAWGISRLQEDYRFRVAGMAATFAVLIGSALSILLT